MYDFVGKESAFYALAGLALADGCKYANSVAYGLSNGSL